MGDNNIPVVIDTGAYSTKVGFAGENVPRAIFPTIVGRPTHPGLQRDMNLRTVYVGEETHCKRGILSLTNPLHSGTDTDTNWEDMEQIWAHAFQNELHVVPEQHPILLTQPPLTSKRHREKVAQILFETFNTPQMYIGTQAVMALYASGLTTGFVVDSGENVSHFVPIYEGWEVSSGVTCLQLAGRDLTDFLCRMLRTRGHIFSTSAERELVREMKEKVCYVSLQEVPTADDNSYSYQLPNGQLISLSNERFLCPEALFRPSLLGMASPGIHEVILKSIIDAELDIRSEFYKHIILAGGNTMFPGLAQRLHDTIRPRIPATLRLKIEAPNNRYYSAWRGAACLAELDLFGHYCVTRQEYDSEGVTAIHKKMF